ncbi:MFS transporter [Neoroseomonas eburnea]|uniref:MFS transporter n=1 Tax=Neoroseomonas eburnea TaxID=1346889 RepID=UPI0030B9F854
MVLAISVSIRHAFGLFLQPMSAGQDWGREVFALAIAVQNLVWGIAQPFAGRLADRYGDGRVIAGGAVLYAAGLALMAQATTPGPLMLSAGLQVGLGLAGTAFTIVFGAVARVVPVRRRSEAMGIVGAAGSFGQFAMLPTALWLIGAFHWDGALQVLSAVAVLMLLMVPVLARGSIAAALAEPVIPARAALLQALGHTGFRLLCLSFFVCGFQIVFIGTHLPAYLLDRGLSLETGTAVLALIGLFNVAGTWLFGRWGGTVRKPLLLTGIYLARAAAIAFLVLAPASAWVAWAFGASMGLLWLGTVPLTNGTVASIFGVRNLSLLGGVVFLFHQMGSFLGGWLGGVAFDRLGSYDAVWLLAVLLSLAAAALSLPISERPIARLQPATGTSQ